jgi:hypothetical protein
MKIRDRCNPTEDELRAWASDVDADAPDGDWELVLSWRMEPGFLRLCVEFAADPNCPKAEFFLSVLYQWVANVARSDDFETRRLDCDRWLEVVRGVTARSVKHWRHGARLIFQGLHRFDEERWWSELLNQKD